MRILHYDKPGGSRNIMSFENYKSLNSGSDNDDIRLKMLRYCFCIMPVVLTGRQRRIYIDHEIRGKSAQTIAREMRLSRATVYKHLRSADEKLLICREVFFAAQTGKGYYSYIEEKLKTVMKAMQPDAAAFFHDYYFDCLTIPEVARKYGLQARFVSNTIMHHIDTNKMKKWGLSARELTNFRKYVLRKKRGERVMDMEEIMRMSQEAIGGNQE